MRPKDADRMANSVDSDLASSVDSDQTSQEQSDLGLHSLPRPAHPKT